MDMVDFAWQVIEMQRTIEVQEAELARLRRTEEDYDELLASSLQHGKVMMGNILELCMTPGVVDALRVNASPEGDAQ